MGYVVYWQLAELGVHCEVVAPTLVPVRAGDRVKTDRRDAEKLAGCYRSGDLTAVWVPEEGSEALRDLVRAREAAKQDQMRARHRLSKFLLRSGQRPPTGSKLRNGLGIHLSIEPESRTLGTTLSSWSSVREVVAMKLRKKRKSVRPKTKLGLPDLEQAKGHCQLTCSAIKSKLKAHRE